MNNYKNNKLFSGKLISEARFKIADKVKSSQISGFYKMPVEKRIEIVKSFSDLNEDEIKLFSSCLDMGIADRSRSKFQD